MIFLGGTMNTSKVADSSSHNIRGHHHGGNITDMISKMSAGIDNAVKAGKLTEDQAVEMKKRLDAINEKLKSDNPGKGIQLSQHDRQQIRKELHAIGKQLYSAMKADGSGEVKSDGLVNELFKKIDSNGDNKIDKDEFASFVKNINNDEQDAAPTSNIQQFSYSITTVTQSTFSITA
jgi:hypothetical protein